MADALFREFYDLLDAALTHRAVGHSCLAEAAASGASSGHFDGQPVMDDPGVGDQWSTQVVDAVEVGQYSSFDRFRSAALRSYRHGFTVTIITGVEAVRQVDAFYVRQFIDHGGTLHTLRFEYRNEVAYLGHRFLTVADDDSITQFGDRFRIEAAGASANNDRRRFIPGRWGASAAGPV